jgi:hypothetical protein
MRVNIDGKGSLSLIGGKLLPIKNIELTEQEIRALAIISTIRVYSVESGMLINASNVDSFFKTEDEEPKEVIEIPSKSAEKVETTAPVAEPAPVVETVEEAPTVEESVEEPVTEETEDETDIPVAEEVTADEEESESVEKPVSGDEVEPVEEAPRSKKNKKRK